MNMVAPVKQAMLATIILRSALLTVVPWVSQLEAPLFPPVVTTCHAQDDPKPYAQTMKNNALENYNPGFAYVMMLIVLCLCLSYYI
jgi:hypothetical protein